MTDTARSSASDQIIWVEKDVTCQAAAYASGDVVGGLLEIRVSGPMQGVGALLAAVILTDLAKQSIAIDLILFGENPSGSTFTENGAITIADADLPKYIGTVHVTDYTAFADNSAATATPNTPGSNLPISVVLPPSGSLYGVLVVRGAPTYASTSDLKLRLGFLPQ